MLTIATRLTLYILGKIDWLMGPAILRRSVSRDSTLLL